MGKRYSASDRQRILESTDIVRLIGDSVELRPKGSEYVGLCPFHDDRSPSMYVNPRLGIYKCFACGAGGRAMRWVQDFYRMDWREALDFLAQRAGIEPTGDELAPPRRFGGSPRSSEGSDRNRGGGGGHETGGTEFSGGGAAGDRRDDDDGPHRGGDRHGRFVESVYQETLSTADLVEAHQMALGYFRSILRHARHGQVARELFARRHINLEMIERFQLGAAPGGEHQWDGLVRTLQNRGADLRVFEGAGLIGRRRSGDGYIDRFRNRLIFPILDRTGRPIAFGARKIDPDDEPKYLNSAEHARFRKSATLYAFDLAQAEMRRTRTAIVTEGYTDVIACHQAGFTNVVATLGTALTREHGRLLQHVCDTVCLIFDGDEAGQKAADRAVEVFFESNVDVQICILPGGADPADLLNDGGEAGRKAFEQSIARGIGAFEYLMQILRRDLDRSKDGLSARQRVIEAFLSRLVGLGFHRMNPVRRGLMLQRLSDLTGLSVEMILRAMPASMPRFAGPVVPPIHPPDRGGDGATGSPESLRGEAASGGRPREGAAPEAANLRDVLARYRERHADAAFLALRPADRARREAREAAEAGVIGCLLQSRGLSSQCETLPADHPGRALGARWFVSSPLRRLFEFVREASDGPVEGQGLHLLDRLEAACPEDDFDLIGLAGDLAHQVARRAEDRDDGRNRLFAAYLAALDEYRRDDADTARKAADRPPQRFTPRSSDEPVGHEADAEIASDADGERGFESSVPVADVTNAEHEIDAGASADTRPDSRGAPELLHDRLQHIRERATELQKQGGIRRRRLPRRSGPSSSSSL